MLFRRLFFALILLFLCSATGTAQTFGGTKVAETGVPYTGVGTFSSFTVRPSVSGDFTAFGGNPVAGPSINASLLALSNAGAVTKIADTTTPVPGGSGNFMVFSPAPIGLDGGVYAFQGNGASVAPTNFGVFSNSTGSLAAVATLNTSYPGGGNFTNHTSPTVSGTTVAFGGTNAGGPSPPVGVFTRTGAGALTTVATNSTPAPGGGTFQFFHDPTNGVTIPNVSGSTVVFNAQTTTGRVGVYASGISGIAAVATNQTTIPGGTGSFTSFGHLPASSGANVAFFGAGSSGQQGIYRWVGGVVTRVADRTTAVPGATGTFNSFLLTDVAMDGDRVAFRGTSTTGVNGIYTDLGGTLAKVVATGDILDGKTVSAVNIGAMGFEGSTIAVMVGFSNGTGGIYRFSPVPEPTGLLAVALLGWGAARVRRRRANCVR